jgi:hypothetical protein
MRSRALWATRAHREPLRYKGQIADIDDIVLYDISPAVEASLTKLLAERRPGDRDAKAVDYAVPIHIARAGG